VILEEVAMVLNTEDSLTEDSLTEDSLTEESLYVLQKSAPTTQTMIVMEKKIALTRTAQAKQAQVVLGVVRLQVIVYRMIAKQKPVVAMYVAIQTEHKEQQMNVIHVKHVMQQAVIVQV